MAHGFPYGIPDVGKRFGDHTAEQSVDLAHVRAYRLILHDAAGRLERLLDITTSHPAGGGDPMTGRWP